MTDKKRLPLDKRHPGKWAVKGRLITPKATKIDVEGPLHEAVGDLVLLLLTIRPTPERVEAMRALNVKLRASVDGKAMAAFQAEPPP